MTELNGIVVRPVRAGDLEAVQALNGIAFEGPAEASLVAALHAECRDVVSLLAEQDGEVAGHIMFSPVTLEPSCDRRLYGLAPMAVRPSTQRRGIGSRLVRIGLAACRERDIDAVVVLGHVDYYPRFGFRPARDFGLACTYDVPDEAFMALECAPGGLRDVAGTVHYHPVFSRL